MKSVGERQVWIQRPAQLRDMLGAPEHFFESRRRFGYGVRDGGRHVSGIRDKALRHPLRLCGMGTQLALDVLDEAEHPTNGIEQANADVRGRTLDRLLELYSDLLLERLFVELQLRIVHSSSLAKLKGPVTSRL